MLALRVRSGELEPDSQWVYAWGGGEGVVYVGATTLHPSTRTWLHLHHEDPNVGRLLARYDGLAEDLDVVAVRLPDGVDRQQVRHGAVAALAERGLLSPRHVCDPPADVERHPETERFVTAVAGHDWPR